MANEENQQPLLPPEPWYTSDVAIRLFVAAAVQVVSLVFRIVGHFTGIEITTEFIDQVAADLTQVIALVVGVMALMKRKNSTIQPLTLTRKSADRKAHTSILDPTTMQPKNPPPDSNDTA